MSRMERLTTLAAIGVLIGCSAAVRAETRTWTGTVSTNWFEDANWQEGSAPSAGDDVVIGAGLGAVLTNSTPELASFSLSGMLTFTNWNTTLSATEIVIQNGGVMTLPAAYTNNVMSNNVVLVCSNLTVASGGEIDVDGKGYAGGARSNTSPAGDGHGPGRGIANAYGVGASHGGRGGGSVTVYASTVYPGAYPYDDVAAPLLPGSGGGGSGTASGGLYDGGAGGGAVRITASGEVVVDGDISANGLTGAGAGSGGSISIVCRTFGGAGTLSVKGGTGYSYHGTGGHGGGGRIAVDYDLEAQPAGLDAKLLAHPGGTLAARYGSSTRGDFGTIRLPDDRFLGTTLGDTISGKLWGFDEMHRDSLTVDNTWVRFAEDGFDLTITNDLVVSGASGMLQVGGSTANNAYQYDPRYTTDDRWYGPAESAETLPPMISVGGDLKLLTGAKLAVFSAPTNGVTPGYGARVDVGNRFEIADGAEFCPFSHPTNGASVTVSVNSLFVASGGRINAVGKGFSGSPASGIASYGPGGVDQTYYAAGGGHGGIGGSSHSVVFGGDAYGSAEFPRLPGSGGGRAQATGGGAILIEAVNGVTVNGDLLAYGVSAGAGGAIDILCDTFAGTNGVLNAAGSNADAHHGAGGGGRIALKYDTEKQSPLLLSGLTLHAAGGAASALRPSADPGTLYFADTTFLGETLTGMWGNLAGLTEWTTPSLTVSNAAVRFMADGFRLNVTGDLTIGEAGELGLGGPRAGKDTDLMGLLSWDPPGRLRPYPYGYAEAPELHVGGDLELVDGGLLSFYSAPSSDVGTEAGMGALLDVAGTVRIRTNSWLRPYAHPTNGAAPLLRMKNLEVAAGGGVDADSRGYSGGLRINNVSLTVTGYGPGKGTTSAYPNGAGYGGLGGNNVYNSGRGATYGEKQTPLYPGSGGGTSSTGGGLIRLEVARRLDLSGSLTANAQHVGGAASGGGIYIRCGTFAGAPSAVLSARGGDAMAGHNGAGGGGRIAVWRTLGAEISLDVSQGTNDVDNTEFRETYLADEGTVYWGFIPPTGTMILLR